MVIFDGKLHLEMELLRKCGVIAMDLSFVSKILKVRQNTW